MWLMSSRKIFRFRRLKWGAPDEKFKLLSEDLVPPGEQEKPRAPQRPGFSIDSALIAVALVCVAISVLALL